MCAMKSVEWTPLMLCQILEDNNNHQRGRRLALLPWVHIACTGQIIVANRSPRIDDSENTFWEISHSLWLINLVSNFLTFFVLFLKCQENCRVWFKNFMIFGEQKDKLNKVQSDTAIIMWVLCFIQNATHWTTCFHWLAFHSASFYDHRFYSKLSVQSFSFNILHAANYMHWMQSLENVGIVATAQIFESKLGKNKTCNKKIEMALVTDKRRLVFKYIFVICFGCLPWLMSGPYERIP